KNSYTFPLDTPIFPPYIGAPRRDPRRAERLLENLPFLLIYIVNRAFKRRWWRVEILLPYDIICRFQTYLYVWRVCIPQGCMLVKSPCDFKPLPFTGQGSRPAHSLRYVLLMSCES